MRISSGERQRASEELLGWSRPGMMDGDSPGDNDDVSTRPGLLVRVPHSTHIRM